MSWYWWVLGLLAYVSFNVWVGKMVVDWAIDEYEKAGRH